MQSRGPAAGANSLVRTSSKLSVAAAVAMVLSQAAMAGTAEAGNSPGNSRSVAPPSIVLAQSAAAELVTFDIQPQPMSEALTALGAQSGLTIIVETTVSK